MHARKLLSLRNVILLFATCFLLIVFLISFSSLNQGQQQQTSDWRATQGTSTKTAITAGGLDEYPVFFQCIRRYLRLDTDGYPTVKVADMTDAIPLIINPITSDVDVEAFSKFVCCFNVPVKYHFIVLNGVTRKGKAMVELLRKAFGRSGRLIIKRNAFNVGYAGSMNQGLRWGMEERDNDEVPWALCANNDIVLGPQVLPAMVKLASRVTASDRQLLKELKEEADNELRWASEGNLTYYNTYAPKGRPLKVLREGAPGVPRHVRTSALLTDRLRYGREHRSVNGGSYTESIGMPFKGRIGMITAVPSSMPAISFTRLFISTVGYFDEGFFPAYMEDIDMRWRGFSLGFTSADAAPLTAENFQHENGINLRQPQPVGASEDDHEKAAFSAYYSRATKSKSPYQKVKYGFKWEPNPWHQTPKSSSYTHIFFNVPYYPVDVWVEDYEYHECFFRKRFLEKRWERSDQCTYNLLLLSENGVLGAEQEKHLGNLTSVEK